MTACRQGSHRDHFSIPPRGGLETLSPSTDAERLPTSSSRKPVVYHPTLIRVCRPCVPPAEITRSAKSSALFLSPFAPGGGLASERHQHLSEQKRDQRISCTTRHGAASTNCHSNDHLHGRCWNPALAILLPRLAALMMALAIFVAESYDARRARSCRQGRRRPPLPPPAPPRAMGGLAGGFRS